MGKISPSTGNVAHWVGETGKTETPRIGLGRGAAGRGPPWEEVEELSVIVLTIYEAR